MALTKADIIQEIAFKRFMPKTHARNVTETLVEVVKSTLSSGEDVMISGFGKFAVKNKKARRGRNPATEEPIMIKPRRVVAFYCSNKLREKINGDGWG